MARAVVISVRSAGGGGDAAITPPLPSLSYSIWRPSATNGALCALCMVQLGPYKICVQHIALCGPGSVDGIATGYGLDGPGIESR